MRWRKGVTGEKPRSTTVTTRLQAPAGHPSLTSVMTDMSLVLPGRHQDPHGHALARDRPPDHDQRQIGSVILGLAKDAQRALARLAGVALKVGARGVEDQEVNLEVEQISAGEEHGPLHPRPRSRLRPVGPAVGLVLVHLREAGEWTSSETHSAAASVEHKSSALFATSANSTRSTSVVKRLGPSTRTVHPRRAPEPVEQPHLAQRRRALDVNSPGASAGPIPRSPPLVKRAIDAARRRSPPVVRNQAAL